MDQEARSKSFIINPNCYFNNLFLNQLSKLKTYFVAFSHGPDSTFLVYFLLEKGFFSLILLHVNYKLRNDADKEAEKVIEFASKLNLKYYIFDLSKNFKSKKKSNLQNWARKVRFKYFLKIAEKEKINQIFVATTFDDVIENFILRGLKKNYWGLFIPIAIKHYQNLIIYRPLLEISKKIILNYLNQKNYFYCLDLSNQKLIYQRNIIRHQITKKMTENDKINIFNYLIIPFLNYYFKIKKKALNWLDKQIIDNQRIKVNFFINQHFAYIAFSIWLKKQLEKNNLLYYPLSYASYFEILEKLIKSKTKTIVLFDNYQRWQICLKNNEVFLKN